MAPGDTVPFPPRTNLGASGGVAFQQTTPTDKNERELEDRENDRFQNLAKKIQYDREVIEKWLNVKSGGRGAKGTFRYNGWEFS